MTILDWLFPRFCLGCGFLGEYLCLKCLALLKTQPNICFYCEKPSPSGTTHSSCIKNGPILGNLSLFRYGGLMTKIIHSHKYQLNQQIINRFLSETTQSQIQKIKEFLPQSKALLVPVPLSTERLRQRGFNQSLIICNYFSKILNLRVVNAVIKTQRTLPQAEIKNKKNRKTNIRGVFAVPDKKLITGKNVVVVDDLVTTGATVNEVALVLKKAGAARIYSFALARP